MLENGKCLWSTKHEPCRTLAILSYYYYLFARAIISKITVKQTQIKITSQGKLYVPHREIYNQLWFASLYLMFRDAEKIMVIICFAVLKWNRMMVIITIVEGNF